MDRPPPHNEQTKSEEKCKTLSVEEKKEKSLYEQ